MDFTLDAIPDALASSAHSPTPLHSILPAASTDNLLWDASDFSTVPLSTPQAQPTPTLISPPPPTTSAMLARANALDDVLSSTVRTANILAVVPPVQVTVTQPGVIISENDNDTQVAPLAVEDIAYDMDDDVHIDANPLANHAHDDDGCSTSHQVHSHPHTHESDVQSSADPMPHEITHLSHIPAPSTSTHATSKSAKEKDNEDPPLHIEIDMDVVTEMGALAYAEFRKKRARELQKDARRREHYANGNLTNLIRIGKKDKSMSERQRYTRRLSKNQDSAAAARIAQKVFVGVLQKLVEQFETERRTMKVEMDGLKATNGLLEGKMCELQNKVERLQSERHNQLFDLMKADSMRAKMVDMPSFVVSDLGAKAELGVRPAPAV